MPPTPYIFSTHDYNLADELIAALGKLSYTPAAEELFKLRGTEYDSQATYALSQIAPERLADALLTTAKDKQIDSYMREQAMVALCNISATNRVRDLIPLLEDETAITYTKPVRGAEWRVCDRAAASIAILLGWESRMAPMLFMRPGKQEETLTRAREWARAKQ